MNRIRSGASTYTQITRTEFEDWLDSIGFRGQWRIKPGRGGVYQVRLSGNVAMEINSTVGSGDDAMGVGRASMNLKLVSLKNGRTLNRKAQGQSHFARTTNWQKNWSVGVDRMRDAYLKAKEFYDNIARVEDLEAYKRDIIEAIERNAEWASDSFLSDLHGKVSKGGVLTPKQEAALLNRTQSRKPAGEDPMLPMLRDIYAKARRQGDTWGMEFTMSIANQIKGGRNLTPKQEAALDKLAMRYDSRPRMANWTFVARPSV